MQVVTLILIVGLVVIVATYGRKLMSQVSELLEAVQAARNELEADKQAILTELARLGLPDEDLQPVKDAIAAFGSALDDVPGVTPPAPPEEPPIA